MRLTRATVALASAFLLAGCSGKDSPPAGADGGQAPPEGFASSTSTGLPAVARPWVAEAVPVSFDGNLGTAAVGCVFPADACEAEEVAPAKSVIDLERSGVNFTGLDVEVTWTAQTPATATLAAGFMVMGTCEGCNGTFYGETTGTSPLHVTLSGENVPLDEGHRFHFYVYNPQGAVYNPAVPASAFVSVDQAFHVEGAFSLLAPPAPAQGTAA